ncbi:MAG: GNAT family N-acetyltransferase [Acholeplasmataceae bacterium]
MKIVSLDQDQFKGYEIDVSYQTKHVYLVKIKKSKHIELTIKKKRIFRNKERSFKMNLFESYIENSDVFGIFERKKLVAVIEGSLETWNNTYRIWNLFVSKRHRKEGFATALYAHIEKQALSLGARAIILEVQSCNGPAISFYEKQGLHFVGLNTLAYTNEDVQRKEVRLEYGKRLKK